MTRNGALLIFVGMIVAFTGRPVHAIDVDLYGEASVKAMSSYVWRGRAVNSRATIQPELTVIVYPVTLNVWGTWDIVGEEASSERTRVDTSIDYTYAAKQVELKAGVVVHAYHDAPSGLASDTYEMYLDASMALDLYPQLYPSVIIYYDFGTIDGFYGAFSVMSPVPISESLDLLVRVTLGAGSSKFISAFYGSPPPDEGQVAIDVEKDALIHATLTASLPIKVWRTLRIIPQVDYVTVIDDTLRAAVEASGDKADSTVLSIAGSWEF